MVEHEEIAKFMGRIEVELGHIKDRLQAGNTNFDKTNARLVEIEHCLMRTNHRIDRVGQVLLWIRRLAVAVLLLASAYGVRIVVPF